MSDQPWAGDACGLVAAFRAGETTPSEALEACLGAVERSELNAFSHLDADEARRDAARADVSLPFGGVPIGVKELEAVEGWPDTCASMIFAERKADHTCTHVERLREAGVVLLGQTTASEFGGTNFTSTPLHGVTRNPWDPDRTPGGSSGGSAAAVAGGLIPIATGSDGGGSIRIPAGFTGLLGLKSTFGRIPKGPKSYLAPLTVTPGCMARSVRDTARWFDVCNGFDSRDTLSLPKVEGWEAGLGSLRDTLRGKRAVVAVDLGSAFVNPAVVDLVLDAADALIADAGLERVEVAFTLPAAAIEWAIGGLTTLLADLGTRYPDEASLMSPDIQYGLNIGYYHFNLRLAAASERFRMDVNETMADVFDAADFIFCATNPDVAFTASGPLPTVVGGVDMMEHFANGAPLEVPGMELPAEVATAAGTLMRAVANNGALTIPANLTGVPAVSIPAGNLDGLPVGLQVIGPHHSEQLLLDLALIAEAERPWPLVAPGSPC